MKEKSNARTIIETAILLGDMKLLDQVSSKQDMLPLLTKMCEVLDQRLAIKPDVNLDEENRNQFKRK
jgi:hypothetical protein